MFNLNYWRIFLAFTLVLFSDIAFGSLEKFETEYYTAIYDNISCVGNIKFKDLELLRSIEIEWSDKDISTQYVSFKILTEREFIEESNEIYRNKLVEYSKLPNISITPSINILTSLNPNSQYLSFIDCYT